MALTREKRNLLFTVGGLLAVMSFFQFVSYDMMIANHEGDHNAKRQDFGKRLESISTATVTLSEVRVDGELRKDAVQKTTGSTDEISSVKGESADDAELQSLERFEPPARCHGGLCTFIDITINSTSVGRIVFLLDGKKRPKAAENFRALSTGEKGLSASGTRLHYKGAAFSRVVHNILIHGGDIHGGKIAEEEKESIYGKAFPHESLDELHEKGLLAMAGLIKGGSEFFVTLDSVAELDNQYVVFGQVEEGMDVVDRINSVPVNDEGEPLVPIIISDCGQLVTYPSSPSEPLIFRTSSRSA